MKKIIPILFASLFLIVSGVLPSHAGVIDPEFQSVLRSLGPDEEVSVIVTFSDKVELNLFKNVQDKYLRRFKLIEALKSKAESTQGPLKSLLEKRGLKQPVKPLWIINGMGVTGPAGLIDELANLPGVENIRKDETVEAPIAASGTQTVPGWNLTAVHAPEIWDLGYTGAGVVVANMDTGVDLNHPDLQSKWRGGTNSWYDPHGEHATPFDAIGHGTATMGIMVGGDWSGTAIGVAPGARWIAVKIYNDVGQTSFSTIHQGLQWLLNPDGNTGTDDAPDVVNCSWDIDIVGGCSSEFEPDIQTLKAAGIAVAFAAGNYGPNASTSVSPANSPGAFAVGAVDQSNNIDPYSSRGPSACDGSIYPHVVAPGVSIKTSTLTFGGLFPDSYMTVSGSSFSAPHAAGAMALLLSAFPDATVSELETALTQSALDLGPAGPDNTYGYGLVDVDGAYQFLLNSPRVTVASPDGGETWMAGTRQTIAWTYSGNPGRYVKVELLKGASVYRTLAFRTSIGSNGEGSCTRIIPRTISPGNDYRIRITSAMDPSITGTSSNVLIVAKATRH